MGFKPGPPPSNQPSTFEFLTDNRLLHNPGITRMPTTQGEWNTFVQELNKWIKNETGNFDPVFTGFSSDPGTVGGEGPSVWWYRYGQIVNLEFIFSTGTSDATDFTITNLPEFLTPAVSTTVPLSGFLDGSVSLDVPQTVKIGSDGIISFYPDGFQTNWTASGSKGSVGGGQAAIYFLRQPGKH